MTTATRKNTIIDAYNDLAKDRLNWKKKNHYFHSHDIKYLSFLIPEGSKILDIGCGVGDTLASLKPSKGVGIDISANMIQEAQNNHPELTFLTGDIEDNEFVNSIPGKFDIILPI